MSKIVLIFDHHHVLEVNGRYQVRASATNYSCGYFDDLKRAKAVAIALSKRREARDEADKVKTLSCQQATLNSL